MTGIVRALPLPEVIEPNGPLVDVDVDGVCANLVGAAVSVFNRRHSRQHGEIGTEWRTYRIEREFPKEISDLIYSIIHEPGFFASIEPYEDAEQALRELSSFATVEMCTSPPIMEINGRRTLNAYAAADKIGWIFRQFDDLNLAANVTLTLKKRRIRTDVLVDDDVVGNVAPWCLAHPEGLGYVVARAYNADTGIILPPNAHRGTFAEAPDVIREWWMARRAGKA